MNPIGIMQGRLSPPLRGQIQSFPSGSWREEFPLASQAGLDCIEWVYEAETETANPLFSMDGIEEIRLVAKRSGIAVSSICADYYMVERLVSPNGEPRKSALIHLAELLDRSGRLGVRYIVLPFVDASSLKSEGEIAGLMKVLHSMIPVAERTGVEVHLETDFRPTLLRKLLDEVQHHLIKANYDIGNSACLGWDPMEELNLIGPFLGSVHVKDRLLAGPSVQLGAGAADFQTSFRQIQLADFGGPLILQAARKNDISEFELAVHNRRFVESQWTMVFEGN